MSQLSQSAISHMSALSGTLGYVMLPRPELFSNSTNTSCSSISIACWIVVFTPQILENFRRNSADGLSLIFVFVWLSGDIFNVIGGILQRVQPTMIILAAYYVIADTILLAQCLHYRGYTFLPGSLKYQDHYNVEDHESEESPLLWREVVPSPAVYGRRESSSPVSSYTVSSTSATGSFVSISSRSKLLSVPSILSKSAAIILVFLAGIIGWDISYHYSAYIFKQPSADIPSIHPNLAHLALWGQIFGYICAALYLGARIPQIVHNYRRKSTEGLSPLFFIFACLGNLTFVLSIFAHTPTCASVEGRGSAGCSAGEWKKEYASYILVNTSWIIGSAGTFMLDLVIFGQFCRYQNRKA